LRLLEVNKRFLIRRQVEFRLVILLQEVLVAEQRKLRHQLNAGRQVFQVVPEDAAAPQRMLASPAAAQNIGSVIGQAIRLQDASVLAVHAQQLIAGVVPEEAVGPAAPAQEVGIPCQRVAEARVDAQQIEDIPITVHLVAKNVVVSNAEITERALRIAGISL